MNPKNAHGVSEFDFLRDHQCCVSKISLITITPAESLFRATLSIFGHGVKLCAIRHQLSAALRIINCLRA
jgi:hypothetical protein